jgi:hypothetical protein
MLTKELTSAILHLLREEKVILASPEDAQYFRASTKKVTGAPPPTPKKIEPLPPVLIPKKVEDPPPPQTPPPPRKETPPPIRADFGMIQALLRKAQVQLIQEIPSDAMAKQIATRWKTKNLAVKISVLSLRGA